VGRPRLFRRLIWQAARWAPVRAAMIAWAGSRHRGADHPFDRAHGVRTSGWLPGYLLKAGDPLERPTTVYGAAQPSIIRTALAAVPGIEACDFLDIGCGKGRALLVAAELGFAGVTGVELSQALARVARRNAAIMARADPAATPIRVVTGDALAQALPAGPLVVFLYNPFPPPVVAQLLLRIEAALRGRQAALYVVYYNPIAADLFDASPLLMRRYAAQLDYDPSEMGFGPDGSDAVVIWQNRDNPMAPLAGAEAAVRVLTNQGRAEVVSG
jgi:SAM-dependent methyltransferase